MKERDIHVVDVGVAGELSRLSFLEELVKLRERAARVNRPASRRLASREGGVRE